MKSLRGRLTLGVVLVLAAVLTAAGVLVSRYVDSSERAAFDDRLERTAQLSEATALDAVQNGLPENDRRLDAALEATATSLRLVVGAHRVLLDTGAPPPRRPRLQLGLATFESAAMRYRAYTTTLRDPDLEGIARLEVVSGLGALDSARPTSTAAWSGLGALALPLAAVGTWLAAELVLRPVRRLRTLASSIADDEDLDRRVPDDTGPAELRSLAASLNAMLERLGRSTADRERALAATRRFAADAGHELRTPLTSVQATLDALRRHPELPEERRAAMLGDAATEQRRMVDLLDGLQALARGDAPEAEYSTVDLAEVADAAVVAAAARAIRTSTSSAALPEVPVAVRGWEPGLRMLVENLVENAAVHGRDGGTVRVSLDDGPVLHVDDDGGGVPEDERGRIFEPFARVDGTDAPGSGLRASRSSTSRRATTACASPSDRPPLGGARFSVQSITIPTLSGRPVRRDRLADDPLARDRAPEAAVVGVAAVVAHQEVRALRDRDRVQVALRARARRRRTARCRLAVADHVAVDDRDRVAGQADDALDERRVRLRLRRLRRTTAASRAAAVERAFAVVPQAVVRAGGGMKTVTSPSLGSPPIRGREAVDEDPLAGA